MFNIYVKNNPCIYVFNEFYTLIKLHNDENKKNAIDVNL